MEFIIKGAYLSNIKHINNRWSVCIVWILIRSSLAINKYMIVNLVKSKNEVIDEIMDIRYILTELFMKLCNERDMNT